MAKIFEHELSEDEVMEAEDLGLEDYIDYEDEE